MIRTVEGLIETVEDLVKRFDALAAALERESGSATAALVAAIEREAVSAAAEVAKIESLSFEIGDLERELRRAEAEAATALAAVSAASRAVTAPSSLASGAAFAAAPLASVRAAAAAPAAVVVLLGDQRGSPQRQRIGLAMARRF